MNCPCPPGLTTIWYRPDAGVFGSSGWNVGRFASGALELRVEVDRAGAPLERVPPRVHQRGHAVVDDPVDEVGGRAPLPVVAVVGQVAAGEHAVPAEHTDRGVLRRVLHPGHRRRRAEQIHHRGGHTAIEVRLVAVVRARGRDRLQRRVRADFGCRDELIDPEPRATVQPDDAVRPVELVRHEVDERGAVETVTLREVRRREQPVRVGRRQLARAGAAHLGDHVDVAAAHVEDVWVLTTGVGVLRQQHGKRPGRALAGAQVGRIADPGVQDHSVVHRDRHTGDDLHPVRGRGRYPGAAGPRRCCLGDARRRQHERRQAAHCEGAQHDPHALERKLLHRASP